MEYSISLTETRIDPFLIIIRFVDTDVAVSLVEAEGLFSTDSVLFALLIDSLFFTLGTGCEIDDAIALGSIGGAASDVSIIWFGATRSLPMSS